MFDAVSGGTSQLAIDGFNIAGSAYLSGDTRIKFRTIVPIKKGSTYKATGTAGNLYYYPIK